MNLDVTIELGIAKEFLKTIDSVKMNLSNHADWVRVRFLVVSQIERLESMEQTQIALAPGRIIPFHHAKNPLERRGRPRFHSV